MTPLLNLDLPTLIWALPEAFEQERLPQNALCGLNMTVSLPAERKRPVRWLNGAPGDAAIHTQILISLRGASAAGTLSRARILQIGGSAPGFYRIESEPGGDVQHESLSTLIDAAATAQPASQPDEPSDYPPEALTEALKIETALSAAAQGYDAASLRCCRKSRSSAARWPVSPVPASPTGGYRWPARATPRRALHVGGPDGQRSAQRAARLDAHRPRCPDVLALRQRGERVGH